MIRILLNVKGQQKTCKKAKCDLLMHSIKFIFNTYNYIEFCMSTKIVFLHTGKCTKHSFMAKKML